MDKSERGEDSYTRVTRKTVWSKHEIEVKGIKLTDRKEMVTESDADGRNPENQKCFATHARCIGEKKITIRQECLCDDGDEYKSVGESSIETELSEGDIVDFLQQWESLWKPKVTGQQFEEMIEDSSMDISDQNIELEDHSVPPTPPPFPSGGFDGNDLAKLSVQEGPDTSRKLVHSTFQGIIPVEPPVQTKEESVQDTGDYWWSEGKIFMIKRKGEVCRMNNKCATNECIVELNSQLHKVSQTARDLEDMTGCTIDEVAVRLNCVSSPSDQPQMLTIKEPQMIFFNFEELQKLEKWLMNLDGNDYSATPRKMPLKVVSIPLNPQPSLQVTNEEKSTKSDRDGSLV